MNKHLIVAVMATCTCLEWTRLKGIVKSVNLQDSTVTIETRDKDIFVVPKDYQVDIIEKHGEMRELKTLTLGEVITLTRTLKAKPLSDSDQPMPEPSPRGK